MASCESTAHTVLQDQEDHAKLISKPEALLHTLKRMRRCNDNVAFRTRGGLRVMVRNDPEDAEKNYLTFDVSVITEDEAPSTVTAIKNEIDIMEEESGCVVIEEYSFAEDDAEGLQTAVDFLNDVDRWTVCPCGEFLIKDAPADMCYYCEMTAEDGGETLFCPICHETGHVRWMVATSCCKQRLHRKCKETCVATESLRSDNDVPRCPMCRSSWISE